MALDLENLRKAVAEAKGDVYEGGVKLEGQAALVWQERNEMLAELDNLKANSNGQDEVPGTPEFIKVQELGAALQEIKIRLQELGVEVPGSNLTEELRKAIE
jgi:hypothetical protein